MLYLSEASIEFAVKECRRRNGYTVIVVVNSHTMLENTFNNLRCMLDKYNDVRFRKNMNSGCIDFKNGSYVRVVPATENARGYKSHLLIMDECVDYELAQRAFYHIECREQADAQRNHYLIREMTNKYFSGYEPSVYNFKTYTMGDWEKEIEDVSEEEFLKVLGV